MMKKLMAFVLAAGMMLSLVACGKDSPDQQGTTAGKVKDTFVVAIGGQPNYLDPAIATDAVTASVLKNMYHSLFTLDEKGVIKNEAVESYTVSDDGLVYTMKLVDGNKWSDGKDVKASDYEFGTKRALGMGAGLSNYVYFITDYVANGAELEGKNVADMDALGVVADDEANTLTFTLSKPCTYFPSLLTSGVFSALRSDFAKEHDSTWADSTDVPTNGAYYPVKIASNEEVVLKKNPNFVNADMVATENLVLKAMEDMDAQLMAYQTGEIDLAMNVDPAVVSQVYGGQPDLVKTDSVINYYVQMNSADWSTAPALNDVRVRRALQLALNRDEIVAALDAGDAFYPLYGYVPKGISGVDGDFRTEADEAAPYITYDPDQAKQLLAEAGYGPDHPLNLVYKYNSNNMHDTVAQVMQQQWREVGINVTFETMEGQAFFADRDKNGNYELARGAMSADYLDPTTFLCMLITSAQPKVVVSDETYDKMIEDAQLTLDPKERMQKLHDAEKYLVETMAYTCPVFGYVSIYLVNPNASGIEFDPVGHASIRYVKCTE